MSLTDGLRFFVTGRRRNAVGRQEVLRARPIRNPVVSWERNDQGETILHIPLQKGRVIKALRWFFPAPDQKQLVLDEIGGDMWELCDGTNTIDDIRRRLCDKYRLERREAEASLIEYLRQLAKRRLVVALGDAPAQTQDAQPKPDSASGRRRKRSLPRSQR
ncbi:MAG: PqqD family protein [Armatimonadota bacterium]